MTFLTPEAFAGQVVWAVLIAAALACGHTSKRVAGLALLVELAASHLNWGGPNAMSWATCAGDVLVSVVLVALTLRT